MCTTTLQAMALKMADVKELPKLPYSYDALEPYIDAKTMEVCAACIIHPAGFTGDGAICGSMGCPPLADTSGSTAPNCCSAGRQAAEAQPRCSFSAASLPKPPWARRLLLYACRCKAIWPCHPSFMMLAEASLLCRSTTPCITRLMSPS